MPLRSMPLSAAYSASSCIAEKLKHGGGELRRTFQLRHVTAIINDLELGVRNLLMKSLAKAERYEFIVAAPNDESRPIDHAEAVIEHVVFALNCLNRLINVEFVNVGDLSIIDSVE